MSKNTHLQVYPNNKNMHVQVSLITVNMHVHIVILIMKDMLVLVSLMTKTPQNPPKTKNPPNPPKSNNNNPIPASAPQLVYQKAWYVLSWCGIVYIRDPLLLITKSSPWMNEWMFNHTPARKTDRLLGVRKR